ncbi:MAG: SGNH/GDSL hydrolase family protein [Deltaproteobacteria bacterium]|nr:SGNH/GDSL hydrolase family protein [Deltaproteobacteria bacterium]
MPLSILLACAGPRDAELPSSYDAHPEVSADATLGEATDGAASELEAGHSRHDRPLDDATSDAELDASLSADATALDSGDPAAPVTGPVLYPAGLRHSPITEDLAANLRAIAARVPSNVEAVFAKVGDSITESTSFLHCFAGTRVDLASNSALTGTLDFFRGGDAAGTSPFSRVSLAAAIGWSARAAITGTSTPLDRELDAIQPRYGIVMFGTNDVEYRPLESFARDMVVIVDRMIEAGVVPLLSSIPPRDDDAAADANVLMFNLVLRAIAQGRAIPFVDYHLELEALPAHGLAGDGVHPSSYSGGSCILTLAGLAHGANVRNLITLEQLDRARRALVSELAPDTQVQRLRGAGTRASPFELDLLPFATLGNTLTSFERTLNRYSCAAQDESGPEVYYRLSLTRPARLTAAVESMNGVDVDLHLLDSSASESGCLARDNRQLVVDLEAGTYFLVADTFVSSGTERAGEFAFFTHAE